MKGAQQNGKNVQAKFVCLFVSSPFSHRKREFQDTSTLDLSLGLSTCYSKKRNGQVHSTFSSVMDEVANVCQEHCQAVSSCYPEF